MHETSSFLFGMRLSALLLLLFIAPLTQAATVAERRHPDGLHYAEVGHRPPVEIHTEKREKALSVRISATLDHAYQQVQAALQRPHNLCEIAPLHLNVKACTHRPTARGDELLTFFTGRKFFQTPDQAEAYDFRYEFALDGDSGLSVRLLPEGKARRYVTESLALKARPLAGNRTGVEIELSYRDGFWLRLASEGYFATLGQGKKGFSVKGIDGSGRPIYVDGIEGAIERNAVRYYFALDAFLAARKTPERDRFEDTLSRWFDLTERFRAQLHEMDKDTYLSYKRREREQQLRLQSALGRAAGG